MWQRIGDWFSSRLFLSQQKIARRTGSYVVISSYSYSPNLVLIDTDLAKLWFSCKLFQVVFCILQ